MYKKKPSQKLSKKQIQQMRSGSYASSRKSSEDSDNLSDDTFLNKIGSEWGEEESELRQAIFF